MSKKIFTKENILLMNEASLSAMSLGVGLTFIRKYNFSQEGYLMQSFFSISIGLERLMKLILLYDYRIKNNKYPKDNYLRKYSHDLKILFKEVKNIAVKHNLKDLVVKLEKDLINDSIIDFFSLFAKQTRYYNLDELTGRKSKILPPVSEWHQKINKVILERHYKPKGTKLKIYKKLSKDINDNILVRQHNENGEMIDNAEKILIENDSLDIKQKYGMMYIFVVINFLVKILFELEIKGGFYPILREFFTVFYQEDLKYVLSKKTWNPLPPYRF